MIHFENKSMLSGCINMMVFDMEPEQFYECYNAWRNGKLIQDAFPSLTTIEREFVQTGITPDEWDDFEQYEDRLEASDMYGHHF
jgi:NDP-sugar pyrophosphorylase family protein